MWTSEPDPGDHELKHIVVPGPSNDELFTILEVIAIDGLVDGDGLQGNTPGRCSLLSMANIRINGEGRRHLQDHMRRNFKAGDRLKKL
jgi:hypothetical protein